MRNDSEKKVEDYLCDQVKAQGGLCIKLNPFWYVGIPDRLVILPGGRIGFCETKRPSGGRRGAKQDWWNFAVRSLGFTCMYVRTEAQVDVFLRFIAMP